MTRDLKYLTLGVGFLTALLVFSMATAAGAIIIIALPALAQTDGGVGDGSSSIGGGGSIGSGNTSTAITSAQMHLAQAMTALQNKNTTGAMLQLILLNQTLSTLSTGAGGMATSGGIPGPGPSTVNPGHGHPSGGIPVPVPVPGHGHPSGGIPVPGPSGGHGAGSSGPGISGGGGPGAGSSGAGR